jgi:serine phosphatase RsbU (regulator of sigma subunit)
LINSRRQKVHAATVVGLIVAISLLRLMVDEPGPIYLLPVILAGLWFGRWPGLLVALLCSSLYGLTSAVDGFSSHEPLAIGIAIRLLVYGTAGWIIGGLSEERLRLSRQLRDRDLELEEVRTIQEALAPSEPPTRPALELATCYLPAEHGVSGDFYLVAPAHDGATLVAVGDVAGRGLDAAKRAWYVRTLIASSADVSDDPAAVLERANRALLDEAGYAAPFVTAACLLFEPGGRLRWALAGHDRPIRLDEGTSLGTSGAGLPLGVSDRLGCSTSSTQLASGAGLLLFTDGLTEARRPPNGSQQTIELFGEERIKALLGRLVGSPSAEVVERVQDEVQGFSGGELADDLCLIAIRRSNRPDTTEVC